MEEMLSLDQDSGSRPTLTDSLLHGGSLEVSFVYPDSELVVEGRFVIDILPNYR
jgi:hypothetical protein